MHSHPSSYFITSVQPNRVTLQPIRQPITVEPSTVQFNDYPSSKISICKLILKNQSKVIKKISVTQPTKTYFEIKLKARDVLPKQSTEIYVIFNPQREKGRIEDEFCVKVDNESTILHIPIVCQYKITANSKLWSSKLIISNKENEEEKFKKTINMRPKRNLTYKNRNVSIDNGPNSYIDLKQITTNLFQERFERISRYIEEKKVKNEVYLGQRQLAFSVKRQIGEYSQKIKEISLQAMLKTVSSRFNVQYHQQGPVIQSFNGVSLNWDINRNLSSLVFKNGMAKIQQQMRKFIISMRFDKIKSCLKTFNQYRQKQQSMGKVLRVEEYLEYLGTKLENNKSMNEFEFQFDRNSIKHEEILIDYQRAPIDYLFRQKNVNLQITQRIGFDNWISMNIIKENYQEVYLFDQHPDPTHYIDLPSNVKEAKMEQANPNKANIDPMEQPTYEGQIEPQSIFQVYMKEQKYYHNEQQPSPLISQDPEKWLQNYLLQW